MAPFFASNGVRYTHDAVVISSPHRDDLPRTPASDPRSPLSASASTETARYRRVPLTIDTSCADDHRLAQFAANGRGLINDLYRQRDAEVDNLIERIEQDLLKISSLKLSSDEVLPTGANPNEEAKISVRSPTAAAVQGESYDREDGRSRGDAGKKDSWKDRNSETFEFGAWTEHKPKMRPRVRIPKPSNTGESTHLNPVHGPESSTPKSQKSEHAILTTSPEEQRELRVCNPDPAASGESSASSSAHSTRCRSEPESPFVDKTRPSHLFSQKVQDGLNEYKITYPTVPRAPNEAISPKTTPPKPYLKKREGLVRRPTVLQPRTRHSCYACQKKKEREILTEKEREAMAEKTEQNSR